MSLHWPCEGLATEKVFWYRNGTTKLWTGEKKRTETCMRGIKEKQEDKGFYSQMLLFTQNDSCQYFENAMLKNIFFVRKISRDIHLIIKFCFLCIQYRDSQKQKNKPSKYFKAFSYYLTKKVMFTVLNVCLFV